MCIRDRSRWLEDEDFETRSVFHPLHSLVVASEQKIDVAIVDINLPDVNGLAFLQELVQLDLFPVIVLTNETQPGLFLKAKELGAFDCLAKPASVEALKRSIDRAVSRRILL